MLKSLLAAATALALVAAAPAAFADAHGGKTLKMAYDADPVSMDPHEQLSGGTLQLSHMIFDPLVRWTQELGFEPRLAESWERVDDTTMRFKLREGVKFHSGNEMTAADVEWTYNRLKESADFKGIFVPFLSLEAVDDYTVEIKTDGPFPLVMHTVTYIFPMDRAFYTGEDDDGNQKDEIVKSGNSFASRNASGTGPYTITAREQGIKTVFERFDDYWDTDSPGNVDVIEMTPIKEAPTRVAALLSGDIDFIAPVPPTDLDRIDKEEDTTLVTMPGTRIITLQLNQDRVEAFKDPKVRQAIVHAINNDGIVKKIMRGFATVAAQKSPEGYLGHNPALTPRYDVKAAQALMEEAGYGAGLKVSMMCPNNR
jgi:peptide/nickel transport system substrate-binding protein